MSQVSTTTSGQPLQALPFSTKPTLIPQLGDDGRWNGKIIKIEHVLLRGLDGGVRMHVWLEPDPRPHNHPWDWIDCKVVRGAYTAIELTQERRLIKSISNAYDAWSKPFVLRAGDPERRVYHETHHQIIAVEPGTVSIMTFGPVVGDGKQWGHMKETAQGYVFELAQPLGGFADALWHCNPHMRPEGWEDPYAAMPVPDMAQLLAASGL